MQQAGFLAQTRRSPTGLALVVLAHAGVLGALVLVKGVEAINPFTQTEVTLIDTPPPPPPDDPPPQPDRQQRVEHVTSVPPIIDRITLGPVVPPLPPLPPRQPDPLPPRDPVIQNDPPTPRPSAPQRARANLGSYFSTDDYPAAALRAGAEGTTRFSLAIGADGRVTNCAVTGSSGNSALDSATCRLLRSRARYTPARDQNRNPIAGQDRGSITWRLPPE